MYCNRYDNSSIPLFNTLKYYYFLCFECKTKLSVLKVYLLNVCWKMYSPHYGPTVPTKISNIIDS